MTVIIWIGSALGIFSTIACLVEGLRKRIPDNLTVFSVLAIEVVLIVYGIAGVIGAIAGAGPRGPAWEFWGYLATALIIPPAAVYWSLIERTRWSNFVLAAVGFTVFVMLVRMGQVWEGNVG